MRSWFDTEKFSAGRLKTHRQDTTRHQDSKITTKEIYAPGGNVSKYTTTTTTTHKSTQQHTRLDRKHSIQTVSLEAVFSNTQQQHTTTTPDLTENTASKL